MNVEDIQKTADAQQLIVDALGQDHLRKELVQTVSHDQMLLEKACLNDCVSIREVNDDGSVTYEIRFDQANISDYINVAEGEEGNIVLNVIEGSKQNELVYMADGRIFIDGNEVAVETAEVKTDANATSKGTPYYFSSRVFLKSQKCTKPTAVVKLSW